MSEGMSKEGGGEVFSNLRAVGEGEDKREQSRNANKRQGNYLQSGKTFQVNEKVFLIIRKTRVFRNIFSFQTYQQNSREIIRYRVK